MNLIVSHPTEKKCPRCEKVLPHELFGFTTYKGRPGCPTYVRTYCKECQKEKKALIKTQAKVIPPIKICHQCDQVLLSDDFYRSSRSSDGLESLCKKCTKKKKAVRYQKRKSELIPVMEGVKRCSRCLEVKNIQCFRICVVGVGKRSAHCSECRNASGREYAKRNKELVSRKSMLRNARKINATPSWVTKESLLPFYQEAVRLSRETGIKHVVDHIIPLRNPLVCGLHVPANLRVITEKENLVKSNKFQLYIESESATSDQARWLSTPTNAPIGS